MIFSVKMQTLLM